MALSVGGGVTDFASEDMRNMTGTGGAWDTRLVFGTHKLIGVEAGYLGSLQAIDTLGLDQNALLLSSGADAAIRVHFLTGEFQPYAFAGAGWRRYDLTNYDTNTSSVIATDNVIEMPLGVGVSYTYKHLLIDVRGSYRPTFDNDLVPGATADADPLSLDTFQVNGRIGWEF